jgi:hypothetical protein
MIGRNEEGQITFNVDDRDEVIAALKEVFRTTDVGKLYLKDFYTKERGDDHAEKILGAAIQLAARISQSNTLPAPSNCCWIPGKSNPALQCKPRSSRRKKRICVRGAEMEKFFRIPNSNGRSTEPGPKLLILLSESFERNPIPAMRPMFVKRIRPRWIRR